MASSWGISIKKYQWVCYTTFLEMGKLMTTVYHNFTEFVQSLYEYEFI